MKYTVHVREVHVSSYEVEAKNPEEAIEIVKNGEVALIDDSTEFSHVLDSSYWTVNDQTGRQVRSAK